ncbi:MAG: transferrin-binding protein-like solute binding protein [Gammaproteobacteria bacterium]|nr:transferrin-binding protein-like solute binding protein [Gammaproteobacteria bacterium]
MHSNEGIPKIAGTFSLGALTPVSSIPTLGTATYLGATLGHYVDPAGTENLAFADVTATVDFGARSIGFNTTNTHQTAGLATISANDNLNLSGTLTYAPGVNQFSGPVTTVGGGVGNAPMTGTATGSFYGPAAEEIGGGFSARGAGVSGYMGAFGGRK